MIILDDEEILERVDEYTLYCHYLQYEPQTGWAYHSPIRDAKDRDDVPSWSMFYSRHPYKTFKWKDNARNKVGDIFDLVQVLFGLPTRLMAYGKVAHDFGLMFDPTMDVPSKIKLYETPPDLPIDLRIKSLPAFRPQDLGYYNQFNIRPAQLHRYHTYSLRCYWTLRIDPLSGIEQWGNPRFPRGLGFAYRIGERYQIYQPNEKKEWKFRTSFRPDDVMGLKELRGRWDLLVITKSMKEVMFFDSIGIDAIATHSEHRGFPAFIFEKVIPRYKQVVVWFDNDGKQSADKFFPGIQQLFVPESTGEKDPTDHCKHYGIASTLPMIKEVIHGAGLILPPSFAKAA